MPFDTIRLGSSAAGAYEIKRAIRFNESDSTEFSRTPGSTGTEETFTFSAWIKKTDYKGNTAPIFNAGADASNYFKITIGSDDKLYVLETNGGAYREFFVSTNAIFIDVSSWMHVLLRADSTSGTADHRIRVYINGVELPGTRTYTIAQNYTYFVNTTSLHAIGRASHNAGEWFNGYMAEINFIDGTSVAASSFGEENEDTGEWVPKKYAGSYGTNGFYLNFSDNSNTTAATLGKDSSGNGHNFTPANFSVAAGFDNDSVLDTPTNNYCTFNSAAVDTAILVNGNLQTATTNGSGNHPCYSTFAVQSGKWYAEFESIGGESWNVYIAPAEHDAESRDQDSAVHNTQSAQLHKGYSLLPSSGNAFNGPGNAWNSSYGSQLGTVLMMAVDLDNNKIYWGHDGTWYDSGDPAAGSNPAFASIVVNEPFTWGVSTTNGHNVKANFGAQGFQHTPPTGFKALCSQNLDDTTILKGSDYFNIVGYTGNGSSQSITGVGFQPDLTWVKKRNSTSNWFVTDAVSGVNKELNTNNTNAQATNTGGITAFGADGFSVGGDGGVNGNTDTFAAWNWKESATAGFDLVSFTGNETAGNTVSHSLGVKPELVIIKNLEDGNQEWCTYAEPIGAEYALFLHIGNEQQDNSIWWNDTEPTSSVITLGTSSCSNGNGQAHIAYFFTSVAGYSKIGKYEGTGDQNGPFIWTDFTPRFVLSKKYTEGSHWHLHDRFRNPYNYVNAPLYPNDTPADEYYNLANAASLVCEFYANGFKIRSTHTEFNDDGEYYIYYAIGMAPFKYANAR